MALQTNPASAEQALAELCGSYWYPLYVFVRRRGHSKHDAEDLTQGFFARLLQKRDFGPLAKEKGRFRSFLLAAMTHFLANEWDRTQAQKRGGGQRSLPIDAEEAERRFESEPTDAPGPQEEFDRQWALSLLETVLGRLAAEMEDVGKGQQFEALKFVLSGGHGRSYAQVGEQLGLSEGAVKIAVHRLRERYRDLIRAEVAQTVASADDVEEEMRYLLQALG